jgi:hypothetical protein
MFNFILLQRPVSVKNDHDRHLTFDSFKLSIMLVIITIIFISIIDSVIVILIIITIIIIS